MLRLTNIFSEFIKKIMIKQKVYNNSWVINNSLKTQHKLVTGLKSVKVTVYLEYMVRCASGTWRFPTKRWEMYHFVSVHVSVFKTLRHCPNKKKLPLLSTCFRSILQLETNTSFFISFIASQDKKAT